MFPEIIKHMTHAENYGVEGLEVYFDHTPVGTIYFFGTKNEFVLPEHMHAEQWGMVIKGEVTYKYETGETKIYKAGLKHQITLHAGYSEFDYVDDPLDGEIGAKVFD